MSDFKYEIVNDEVTIIEYVGNETVLNIPSEIENKKVTSIGKFAFSYCSGLTEITMPDSVTRIGFSAFSDCNVTVYTPHKASYYGESSYHGVKEWIVN